MDKSFRSYAKYGTVCEIVAHEQTRTIVFNPQERPSQQGGNTLVQAIGIHRFRIERVLHRALDGLILTCEVTNFLEEGSEADLKAAESTLFTDLKAKALGFCQLSQKLADSAKAKIFRLKEQSVQEIGSPSELGFFICQLLERPLKSEF